MKFRQGYPASLHPGVPTQQLRADPTYGNANTLETGGWSQAHQFQFEVRRNVSKGLLFQAFYVLQKVINTSEQTTGGSSALPILGDRQSGIPDWNQRLALEKGDSGLYPRQQFTINFLYDLPFGPGQALGGGAKGVLGKPRLVAAICHELHKVHERFVKFV